MSIINLNALLNEILFQNREIDFREEDMMELFRNVNADFQHKQRVYEKMYDYYKGKTDARSQYKQIEERSNLFTNVNYFKKFIKEEVSYTVGNKITYESLSGNVDFIKNLEKQTHHWSENHDGDVMKYLLIFTRVYELYYRDVEGRFCSRVITPLNGYAYRNYAGKILFFIHSHSSQFEEDVEENGKIVTRRRTYYDVYTDKYIYYFNDQYKQIKERELHKFKSVPVSVGILTYEGYNDSLYADIKGLQDALETNLSDMANEISDFRNAYLFFKGCHIDDDELKSFKHRGAIEIHDQSGKADVKWLIKDINDTFIQNSLDRYTDLLYQVAAHINHNEKLQSNLSSLTLRSRLIALENKCTLNINSHKDIVKNRLRFLCEYLNSTELIEANKLDDKDIKITYTPNIPQDDAAVAQMLSSLPPGVISKTTSRGLFSFIHNPAREGELCDKEAEKEMDMMEDTYMKGPSVNNPAANNEPVMNGNNNAGDINEE